MDALRSALATRPEISWVQLPQAGVEQAFQAGVVDPQRQWTSAKGAFAEPVAEHALALILAGLRQLKIRAQARTWGEPAGESLFGRPSRWSAQAASPPCCCACSSRLARR